MPLKNKWFIGSRCSRLRFGIALVTIASAFSGCQGEPATTPGLELQSEDYGEARNRFRTQLVRQGPAPQQGEALQAPPGAQQVVYLPALSLKAWLSLPPSGATNAKHPAVLFLHDGFAIGQEDWSMARPYQEAGYLVMMPVLGGENGQGGYYSLFYNEVGDVLSAAEYLAKVPSVDTSHIYIAGHSVGGTLTQLSVLTSSRFKAAASFSGAPDVISWSKMQPDLIPFDANQIKEFQMRSSLAFAGSFKCPTRLYYGSEEQWCEAPSQATAQRAKAKGLDVEAVSVAGDHSSAVPEEIKQSIAFFQSQQ